ncbi:Interferon alpha-inducible protein 27-like protein 2 [Camelus dromedarius]|uniref:Interferon alpha-inducible protein 27-like protein 2 n=1 Tax=Camelus dromedarius TaxID=9838 RepID=A0A5N4E198_CAMDR|nr:Interferon alpha-inducible protein 27-like protein 2 [Camelus dromedarius]
MRSLRFRAQRRCEGRAASPLVLPEITSPRGASLPELSCGEKGLTMIKRAAGAAIGGGDLPGSLASPGLHLALVPGWEGDLKEGSIPLSPRPRLISSPPAALAVGAVPVVLGALGFTGAGIAASSIAAKMMSAAAIANGGGVAAGSLVATLQSVGAAGLSTSSNILLGSVGSAFGALLGGAKKATPGSPPAGPRASGEQPEENVPQVEPPKSPVRSEKHEK